MKLTQLKCSPKIKMAGGQTSPKNWVANNFEPARKPLDNNCVSRRDFMLWLVQIKLKPCQPQEICNNTIVEREASKPLTLKTSWSLSHSCEWILGIGKSCWRRGATTPVCSQSWQWKFPLNGQWQWKIVYKLLVFHCQVWIPKGKLLDWELVDASQDWWVILIFQL